MLLIFYGNHLRCLSAPLASKLFKSGSQVFCICCLWSPQYSAQHRAHIQLMLRQKGKKNMCVGSVRNKKTERRNEQTERRNEQLTYQVLLPRAQSPSCNNSLKSLSANSPFCNRRPSSLERWEAAQCWVGWGGRGGLEHRDASSSAPDSPKSC